MVDNSPELNSKIDAAQQEENRWSEIIATYRDEYDENLISSFAFFERMVKGLTERYQVDNSTIDPAALEGLWKIFQATRKAVVEAYGFIKTEPETFREKITAAGMKTIDGLFHADMFSGKGSTLWHTLQGPRALVEGGLEDEYGIKTHVPYTGQSPD